MNGLKICCEGLNERIIDGSIRVDYITPRVMTRDGKTVNKCHSCGKIVEWVDEAIE